MLLIGLFSNSHAEHHHIPLPPLNFPRVEVSGPIPTHWPVTSSAVVEDHTTAVLS